MKLSEADLAGADEAVLKVIVEQGEKRLSAQCDFVEVQEARAGDFSTAAATIAAGAVAVAGATIGNAGHMLFSAASVATVGFSAAAAVAFWSIRSGDFDSVGWYPVDFVDDLRNKRSGAEVRNDFILDLDIRLSRNAASLARRGKLFNIAAGLMVATAPLALMVGLAARLLWPPHH